MLVLGLADGLASIVGIYYKSKKGTKRNDKTAIGSATFLLVTFLILAFAKLADPSGVTNLTWLVVVLLPIAAMLLENMSIFGLDDLTVPLLIVIVLRWL